MSAEGLAAVIPLEHTHGKTAKTKRFRAAGEAASPLRHLVLVRTSEQLMGNDAKLIMAKSFL